MKSPLLAPRPNVIIYCWLPIKLENNIPWKLAAVDTTAVIPYGAMLRTRAPAAVSFIAACAWSENIDHQGAANAMRRYGLVSELNLMVDDVCDGMVDDGYGMVEVCEGAPELNEVPWYVSGWTSLVCICIA